LEKRLKEAEAALGRKQMEVEFLNKMIDIIEERYEPGLKKKAGRVALGWFQATKGQAHRFKMKDLYAIAGLTRQGFWKHQQREKQRAEKVRRVLALLHEVRSSGHSRMGCRTAYWKVRDRSPVGRDLFERIGLGHGFRLKRWRNKRKTTIGQTDEVCPNRVEGLKIKRMDQVWQSDICYVPFKGKHLYVVTIIDVYSRRLLALHAGRTLEA